MALTVLAGPEIVPREPGAGSAGVPTTRGAGAFLRDRTDAVPPRSEAARSGSRTSGAAVATPARVRSVGRGAPGIVVVPASDLTGSLAGRERRAVPERRFAVPAGPGTVPRKPGAVAGGVPTTREAGARFRDRSGAVPPRSAAVRTGDRASAAAAQVRFAGRGAPELVVVPASDLTGSPAGRERRAVPERRFAVPPVRRGAVAVAVPGEPSAGFAGVPANRGPGGRLMRDCDRRRCSPVSGGGTSAGRTARSPAGGR